MNCYVDSSVILRILLRSKSAYKDFGRFNKIGASELLLIECGRVLERYRLEGVLDDGQIATSRENLTALTDGMHVIELSGAIKKRARESFPTIIGTLDAIHLSTALLWKEFEGMKDLTILSHDRQMIICARALGFGVLE